MAGTGFIKKKQSLSRPIDLLLAEPHVGRMSNDQRREMTTSCKDCNYIPKVRKAGEIQVVNGGKVQILHNGILVEADGYTGEWMTGLIRSLKGHHEPQEEKVFYEVLKRIEQNACMIELGSYWAYYTLWFKKEIKNATAICCEPDPANLTLGKRNAKLNKIPDIKFIRAAAGSQDDSLVGIAMDSAPDHIEQVKILSVDKLVLESNLEKVDILHMDVQGVELDALKGARNTIQEGKLRFIFVSTHHYLFSGSPMTHQNCKKFIEEMGGHIITSHTIPESFSGDGLIVASFDKQDQDFFVETSLNHTDESLFRSYEKDLQILVDYYDKHSN